MVGACKLKKTKKSQKGFFDKKKTDAYKYLREFEIPEVLTMQMRGFRWASEGKYHPKENLISPVYKK